MVRLVLQKSCIVRYGWSRIKDCVTGTTEAGGETGSTMGGLDRMGGCMEKWGCMDRDFVGRSG